ncbi:hypothetical protein DN730_05330 [Marinomonas piezotolerans]|uniref:Uncharacterized protein n=1 Tax=Marinomonas piezotolerans TaxID=2213058 RepID=A0A370UBC6_9GAMM|nr:hypothetical protein DN730_05330 [Marinomonas piezotolerans]
MKSSYKTVFIIFVSFIISEVVDEYFHITWGTQEFTLTAHIIFLDICLIIWCKQHGRENGHRELKMYPILCALIGFIGVPAYAYRFYGFNGGTVLLFKAIVVLVVTDICSLGAATLFSTFYV